MTPVSRPHLAQSDPPPDPTPDPPPNPLRDLTSALAVLHEALAAGSGADLLSRALAAAPPGRLAVVSSFGAESAVLLDLVARLDPATPVLFLETGKHFPETLAYRDLLVDRLGLSDVRALQPEAHDRRRTDPSGDLWAADPDACCALRKVRPLERALTGFDVWVSGRKRFHGGARARLPSVEVERAPDGATRLKLNPLADWTAEALDAYFERYALPRHPLWPAGYLSVGCAPCTAKADPSAVDRRAGRWQGRGKTECGIHRRAG